MYETRTQPAVLSHTHDGFNVISVISHADSAPVIHVIPVIHAVLCKWLLITRTKEIKQWFDRQTFFFNFFPNVKCYVQEIMHAYMIIYWTSMLLMRESKAKIEQ